METADNYSEGQQVRVGLDQHALDLVQFTASASHHAGLLPGANVHGGVHLELHLAQRVQVDSQWKLTIIIDRIARGKQRLVS